MLKIVFVGHRDLYFGAESVLFRVIRLLKSDGTVMPFVLLPRSSDRGFSKKLKEENISEIQHARYKLIGGSLLRSLICLCYNLIHLLPLYFSYRKQKVDGVYTNTSVNISGAILALLLNKPHTWHWHEQPTSGTFKWIPEGLFPVYRYFIRRKHTTLIFISNTQQQLWEQEFNMKIGNSQIIYTPAEETSGAGVAPASPDGAITFGFLGSLTASKNLLTLIDAFKALREAHPAQETTLVIMGAGDQERTIHSHIQQLQLENEIKLLPYSTDTEFFFQTIAVFVLPSVFESWGLVVLEAIQQGKAVICTQNTGLTEILEHGKDCLFVNPKEITQLKQAMERLLLDPQLVKSMGAKAQQTLQHYQLGIQFDTKIKQLFQSSAQ